MIPLHCACRSKSIQSAAAILSHSPEIQLRDPEPCEEENTWGFHVKNYPSYFDTFVSLFQQNLLDEKYLPLLVSGETQQKMEETIIRLRRTKSARSVRGTPHDWSVLLLDCVESQLLQKSEHRANHTLFRRSIQISLLKPNTPVPLWLKLCSSPNHPRNTKHIFLHFPALIGWIWSQFW